MLPIQHDNDMLSGKFGRYVIAAGAVGELFPIIAIALFLTGRDEFSAIASLLAVAAAAVLLTVAPRIAGERQLQVIVKQGQRATSSDWSRSWTLSGTGSSSRCSSSVPE